MIGLFLSALALAPSTAAPSSTQCDAKPFTLKKPVQTAAATPPPAPKPAPKPKPQPKIAIGCKQPAAKTSG
jgi:hypothetical protein